LDEQEVQSALIEVDEVFTANRDSFLA